MVYALQACLSWSFESLFVDLHISTTCTSWSSLDTGVVDMLHGPISFCHNSKIYLDVLVIAYNRIAWGMGGGGSEYKSGATGKLPPKAKLDSLYVSLEMLESRSVINYCIPIIISNAITHSLFDVPDYIFLILIVIHRRLQIFHGLVQFKVTSYTSYLKTDYYFFFSKYFPDSYWLKAHA